MRRVQRLAPALALLMLGSWPAPARPVPPPATGVGKSGLAARDLAPALARGLGSPSPRRARLPGRALVLLVDFADRPHGAAYTPAFIDSLFFSEGHGSVREFYRGSSFGRFDLTGSVTVWIRLPQSYAFYADAEHEGAGIRGADPRNARGMVADAVRAADPLMDFARFDDDGPDGSPSSGDDDGMVDALVVVHAGDGAEFGDRREILSHNWYMQEAMRTADGVTAWRYMTVAESSPLGVRVHEYGHVLGLADLYDRRSTTRLAGGLGDWSLMASGGWLEGGARPADLDAASKLELGFVDAVVPAAGGAALPLRPAREGAPPDVYRVWTHGLPGRRFFVVENRRRRAPEDSIPGSGMLVYDVDLDRPDNDDLERPRVRLLQADGREDIERRINNGDAGDPFPGPSGRLDADTDPSTRDRDGRDTQVRFLGIAPPTATMQFDLVVDTTPALVVESQRAVEVAGDQDGNNEAGEDLELRLRVRNVGLATGALEVQLAARPPDEAEWTVDAASFLDIAKQDTAGATFRLRPRADLGDPYGLALRVRFATAAWRDSTEVVLGLGERRGFLACFGATASRFTQDCSDPAQPWTVTRLDAAGTWQRQARAGELAEVWRSAAGLRYANAADVALVSPSFQLQAASQLRLLHGWATEDLGAGFSADGGRVELSMDGGTWEVLVPRGGYPRRFEPTSVPQMAGEGAFGGPGPRRWDVFDLGARAGSARLRFRFAADDSLGDAGWEIARVEVGPAVAAPAATRIEILAEPNPVRLPARIVFRVTAPLTAAARPTTLHLYDLRGRLVRTLGHAAVPAASALFVWDGTDGTGQRVASGAYVARLDWGGVHGAAKLLVVR